MPVELLDEDDPMRSPIECGRNRKELDTGATVPLPGATDSTLVVDGGMVERKRLLLTDKCCCC